MIRFAKFAAAAAALGLLTVGTANAQQTFTIDFDGASDFTDLNDNFDDGIDDNFSGVDVNFQTTAGGGASSGALAVAGFGPQTDGSAAYSFSRGTFNAFEIFFAAESSAFAVQLNSIDLQLFEYGAPNNVSPTSVTAQVQVYSSADGFATPVFDQAATFGFTPVTVNLGGVQSAFGGSLVLFVDYTGLTLNDPNAGGTVSADGYIGLDNITGASVVPGPGALVTALMGAVPAAGMLIRRRRK